jgi:hypothetical protein
MLTKEISNESYHDQGIFYFDKFSKVAESLWNTGKITPIYMLKGSAKFPEFNVYLCIFNKEGITLRAVSQCSQYLKFKMYAPDIVKNPEESFKNAEKIIFDEYERMRDAGELKTSSG